ncbi:MAG TPA: hypothetical protein VMZ52_09460 [Bryobacteraceae bacterium]|nr:hypothetical protein [Bryobacteraceae bacterium]
MAALKTRNRAVVFRLSQDEYEGLKAVCYEKGMNFSEFARSELLALAECGDSWQMFQTQLNDISGHLMKLDLVLQEICRAMNQTTAACRSACLPAAQEER